MFYLHGYIVALLLAANGFASDMEPAKSPGNQAAPDSAGNLVGSVISGLLTAVSAENKEPFKEPATGILFPSSLGKWNRDQVREYGPGLGVSVGYNSEEGLTATIYIYDLKLMTIPDGPASKVVKDHFEQTKRDVSELQRRNGGSAKQESEGEIRLGAAAESPKSLQAIFTITEKSGNELTSHVYLTGYKNQFLKIRISYPRKNEKIGEAAIEKLLSDIGGLLKM